MPYALLVGSVTLLVCLLPVAYGLPWWAGLVISAGLLYGALQLLGRRPAPKET